jgi:hypothetical protein
MRFDVTYDDGTAISVHAECESDARAHAMHASVNGVSREGKKGKAKKAIAQVVKVKD